MKAPDGVTRAEIEDGLMKCALLVDRYGDCMQPYLDKFEKEYEALRKPPEVERIKNLIADARKEDGLD